MDAPHTDPIVPEEIPVNDPPKVDVTAVEELSPEVDITDRLATDFLRLIHQASLRSI